MRDVMLSTLEVLEQRKAEVVILTMMKNTPQGLQATVQFTMFKKGGSFDFLKIKENWSFATFKFKRVSTHYRWAS